MTDTITRCPKCQTSFRITDAHLKSAKGAVRCGSCLNIFNARDYLIAPPEATPQQKPLSNKPKSPAVAAQKTSPAKEPPKPAPTAAPPAPTEIIEDDEDDVLISDDMPLDDTEVPRNKSEYDADFNDNILYSKTIGSQESNLFERELIDEEDDNEETSDESWALDLMDDDEEEPEQHSPTREEIEHAQSSTEPVHRYDEPAADESNRVSEDDASNIFDDPRPSDVREPVFTSAEPSTNELEAFVEPDYETPPSKHFIHAIEPEPVEFSYKRNYSLWESKQLWVPLIVLMATALVGQVAWLQFDKLNRTEPYRSYYAIACEHLNCSLPPLRDRAAIRAVNLVVRSHPKHTNALVVDAILQNSASYPQSFPALDLVFTDMQDKTVAARRFTPDEYLGGEMAGKNNMPSRQPIHIALEIVDPGPNAVGYSIAIAN